MVTLEGEEPETTKKENGNMKTESQLKELTGKQLVELYNEITGDNVKKFRDTATAVRRVLEAQEAAEKFRKTPTKEQIEAEEKDAKTTSSSLSIFNHTPSGTIKPHRAGTGRARLIEVLSKGATIEQAAKASGWNTSRVRVHIRELHNYCGYGLRVEGDKIFCYV